MSFMFLPSIKWWLFIALWGSSPQALKTGDRILKAARVSAIFKQHVSKCGEKPEMHNSELVFTLTRANSERSLRICRSGESPAFRKGVCGTWAWKKVEGGSAVLVPSSSRAHNPARRCSRLIRANWIPFCPMGSRLAAGCVLVCCRWSLLSAHTD